MLSIKKQRETHLPHIIGLVKLGRSSILASIALLMMNSCFAGTQEPTSPEAPNAPSLSGQDGGATTINKDVALLIALGFVHRDMDTARLDKEVRDAGENWEVVLKPKDEFRDEGGGGAVVEVDKKTGKVAYWYISK